MVTVNVRLTEISGKRLVFKFTANDGIDAICNGSHERFVINAEKFVGKLAEKTK